MLIIEIGHFYCLGAAQRCFAFGNEELAGEKSRVPINGLIGRCLNCLVRRKFFKHMNLIQVRV